MIQQMADMSSALDQANAMIRELQGKSDTAWNKMDERLGNQEVKITQFMDNAKSTGGGENKPMKLVNDTAIVTTVFTNIRSEWTTWSRTIKAHLDSKYSGFRKMLEWAEVQENPIDLEMIDGTGWRYARESNGQLFNFMLTITKLEAQSIINNMDPTMGYECWRKIAQFYDPPGGDGELDKINMLLNTSRCKALTSVVATVEGWENNWNNYVEKTKEVLPDRWKVNLLLRMIPK